MQPSTALSEYRLAHRAIGHFLNSRYARDVAFSNPRSGTISTGSLMRLTTRGCATFIVTSTGSTRRSMVYAGFPNLQLLAVNANFGIRVAFLLLSKEDTSEDVMARIIEFYIPARFHKPVKWVTPAERGKVLEFPTEVRKSA